MVDLPTGSRVVIRRRLAPEEITTGATLTDVVGELTASDGTHLTVRTRSGDVRVAHADVVASRVIPPKPVRRGAPHRAIGIEDLHLVMTKGQPGLEHEWLGPEGSGWLLRAGGGWTGRSNSALPVGEPGRSLPEAVTATAAWYEARGLPPLVMLPRPSGMPAEADPLGAHLLGLDYLETPLTDVLTGRVADLLGAGGPPGVRLTSAAAPDEDWFRGSSPRLLAHLGTARRILALPHRQVFVTAFDDEGDVAGVARVALADGWAGIFGVHVREDHRRRGVGRALTAAAAAAAREAATDLVYLQVERHNTAAQTLYRGLGLEPHHEYTYLGLPPTK